MTPKTCGAAFFGIDSVLARNETTMSAHAILTISRGSISPRFLAFSISCASACALTSLALLARAASSGRASAPIARSFRYRMYPRTAGTSSYRPRSDLGITPSLVSCWTRRSVRSSSFAMTVTG